MVTRPHQMQLVVTPAKLTADHTAKGASTSSEELNVQTSPRTGDEYNIPYHEDQLQEH